MNAARVSIIIPAYNAEKYLPRCLDSVIKQTFKNIEIIIINDGSTDETEQVIDQYLSRDERIVKVNQQNQGTGIARNHGINVASGAYISFVDADDTIEPSMIEIMLNKAFQEDSEIVICEANKIDQFGQSTQITQYKNISKDTIFDVTLSFKVRSSIWDKLYKKSLFINHNLFFPNFLKHNEDNAFMFKLLYFSKNVSFVDEYLYNWHIVENSKSRSISTERLDSILTVLNIRYEFLNKHGLYYNYRDQFIESMLRLINLRIQNVINHENNQNLIRYIEDIIDSVPYFNKENLYEAKKKNVALYFAIVENFIKLFQDSKLFKHIPINDIEFVMHYKNKELGVLQNIVDKIEHFNIKDFYIYGMGDNFRRLLPAISKYNILGVIDQSANTHDDNMNYQVCTLGNCSFKNNEDTFIIVTSLGSVDEICLLLNSYAKRNKIKIRVLHSFSLEPIKFF